MSGSVGSVQPQELPEQVSQMAAISHTEDQLAKFFDEKKGFKDQASKKQEEKIDKALKTKSEAMAFLDRELDPSDLLRQFSKKVGQDQNSNYKQLLKQEISKSVAQDLEKQYQKDMVSAKAAYSDQVVLSEAVTQFVVGTQKPGRSEGPMAKKLTATEAAQADDAGVFDLGEKETKTLERIQRTASPDLPSRPEAAATKAAKTQQSLQQYLSVLSETLLTKDTQKHQRLADVRQALLGSGEISQKQLSQVEGRVKQVMEKDLRRKLKDQFMELTLSYEKGKATPDVLAMADAFQQLQETGKELGVLRSDADVREVKEEARRELRQFLAGELDDTIISERSKGTSLPDLVKKFNKLNALSGASQFDEGSYARHFMSKLENLGLRDVLPPQSRGSLDTDPRGGGFSGQHSRSQQPFSVEIYEELQDQIRALYMRQHMPMGLREMMGIKMELLNAKSKLKKTEFYDEELFARLRQEGDSLARLKLAEMLRESMEERAALSQLRGPEYELVQKKLKASLKALRAMGYPVPKVELKRIRDQVNKVMFSIVREEYLKVLVHLEMDNSNGKLEGRKKELEAVLTRLKTESGLTEPLRPSMMSKSALASDTQIIEAA